jgi:hypothetical protein
MEIITRESQNNYASQINIKKSSKEIDKLNLCDLHNQKEKNKRQSSKTIKCFLTKKNKLNLKSFFDHKGTKKFLADKMKAMEELDLNDEIIEEEKNENNISLEDKKSKSKVNKNKISKKYRSHKILYNFNLNINDKKSSKKHKTKNKKRNNNNYNCESKHHFKNYKDIGSKKFNNDIKRISKDSIQTRYSNILYLNEPSYLMNGEDISFLNTILVEMTNCN